MGGLWGLLRNLLGVALIATGIAIGPVLPGPGFIPLALLGLALVTFPGKRRLVARILRGRPVRFRLGQRSAVRAAAWLLALAACGAALWYLTSQWPWLSDLRARSPAAFLAIFALAIAACGAAAWLAPWAVDATLRSVASSRARVRRTLRRVGLILLPPRQDRSKPLTGRRTKNERPKDERVLARAHVEPCSISKA